MITKLLKKIGIGFFILIILAVPVLSAPPFITEESKNTVGYQIKFPEDRFIRVNEDYEFEFHIFNTSNGVPITSGINCTFHLYNESGKHLYENNYSTFGHTFDIGVQIKGTNFSKKGALYYIFQCNNSNAGLGGFIAEDFVINNSGEPYEDMTYLYTLIGFIILALVYAGVELWKQPPKRLDI